MTTKAFWLWPDWSGGCNLLDPGTQPFWMLDPCPEMYSEPEAPTDRCEGCHKLFPKDETRIKHADPYGKKWWVAKLCYDCYRPTLPPGSPKGLMCRLGKHKFESYSGSPWLFSCTHCGEQKDASFEDPTGVQCYIGYSNCFHCDSPFLCCNINDCCRGTTFHP